MSFAVAYKGMATNGVAQKTSGPRPYSMFSVRHRDEVEAGELVTKVMVSGKWRRQMNVALPTTPDGEGLVAPIENAVCQACGAVYSQLMKTPKCVCQECETERIEEARRSLEMMGIPMGMASDHDPQDVRLFADGRKMQPSRVEQIGIESCVTDGIVTKASAAIPQ